MSVVTDFSAIKERIDQVNNASRVMDDACDIIFNPDTGLVLSHNAKGIKMDKHLLVSDVFSALGVTLQDFALLPGSSAGKFYVNKSHEQGRWSVTAVGDLSILRLNNMLNKSPTSAVKAFIDVIDLFPGVVFVKDTKGAYVYMNQYGLSVSEFSSQDDIIGCTDKDLWPDSASALVQNDHEVIETRQTLRIVEKFTRRNGQTRYYAGYKMPIVHDGKVIALIGNMVDVSSIKQKFFELKDQKELAVKQNQSKLEFIRNMQHDIRTPFSGVLGMANLLFEREQCQEKKSMLDALVSSADELLTYCNDIIDYANVEGGQFILLEKPFDLHKLLQTVYKLERPAALNKSLALEISYDDSLGKNFLGDMFRIQRILINLVGNAIKFTDEGRVQIIVKKLRECTHKREVIVCIQVIDTGIGIRTSDQDMIFEKMTKVSPSSQGLYRGHGFGLRIVKQFTEEIEGNLDLESSPESGTKVSVIFPLRIPLAQDEIY